MNIYCYQHHINDWRRDTAQLTHEQRGVYREMMDQYYVTGGNMPSDHEIVCRMVSAITPGERNAVAHAIEEFFYIRADKLRHKRCDEELAKIGEKKHKAKESADAMWLQRREKMASERISERNANQKPITNNHKKESISATRVASNALDGFDEFWKVYPKHVAKITAQKSYKRALKSGIKPEELARAAIAYGESISEKDREFIKHPATWLNGGCWEDFAAQQPSQAKAFQLAPDVVSTLRKHPKFTDAAIGRWIDACTVTPPLIIAPSAFHADWIEKNFSSALNAVFGCEMKITVSPLTRGVSP